MRSIVQRAQLALADRLAPLDLDLRLGPGWRRVLGDGWSCFKCGTPRGLVRPHELAYHRGRSVVTCAALCERCHREAGVDRRVDLYHAWWYRNARDMAGLRGIERDRALSWVASEWPAMRAAIMAGR